jgi:hypothetical protein
MLSCTVLKIIKMKITEHTNIHIGRHTYIIHSTAKPSVTDYSAVSWLLGGMSKTLYKMNQNKFSTDVVDLNLLI